MNLEDLIAQMHVQVNITRSILHLISSVEFSDLFAKANNNQKKALLESVEECNLMMIKDWINRQRRVQQDYYAMTVKELRKVAAIQHIVEYQYMDKIQLIMELENVD